MTILACSAVSLAVPRTESVADARIPTYTVEERNNGFRAVGTSGMSNGFGVLLPGVTAPLTFNAGVPVYTVLFTVSKYTAKIRLLVPLVLSNSTDPKRRTVSTMVPPAIPMELTVCTGIVSSTPVGGGSMYGRVSAFALLRKLKTSILKIA